MSLAAGERLGPYEILASLGAGAASELYKARDTRNGREVAFKVYRDRFSESFEREARAAAELNHPRICTLYDVGPNYLVMEFIDGVPLKGPLSLNETLRFSAEICDALDYAHQYGIAHGDLKTSNILVTSQGIKLLNFGLTNQTPSDIYAFAGVLYEMLMGRPITAGRRPVQPAALEKVLQKCQDPDPAQRWQSVSDLKQALIGVSQGRGYRLEYIFAGAAVAMLIVGLALLVMQFPSHQKLSDKDVLVLGDFINATGDAIFDGTLRTALAIQLEQSPFLKIVDDDQVRKELTLTGRAPDTRISNVIAHDICMREHGTAMINGAIADQGKTFVITIQAVTCRTGATLAREQLQAEGREQVLNAISKATIGIRAKLGESPNSLQNPSHRAHQEITGSLEAVQFYSLGMVQRQRGNHQASIGFFQHAIELDPNFAIAYLGLGRAWKATGDSVKARKSYEDFFAIWKEADPDLPVIAQAKKEFGALK